MALLAVRADRGGIVRRLCPLGSRIPLGTGICALRTERARAQGPGWAAPIDRSELGSAVKQLLLLSSAQGKEGPC